MGSSKLFVSITAILFLLTSLLFAQTDSVNYKSQVQFHLVNGYSLSYLNSLSNSSALRYKLDFGFSVGKTNNDGSNSSSWGNSGSSSSSTATDDHNYQMLSLTVQYLSYPLNEKNIKIFIGAGPFISLDRTFSSGTSNQIWRDGQQTSNETVSLRYSLNIGIGGSTGVECLITKNISLIGEYGITAGYGWSEQKNTSKTNQSLSPQKSEYHYDISSNGWNIGLGNLRLGIAFRF